ncbi:DinB family protein [Paenarthrobacter ilicis]|uniref:Damage-inducible protein DinB n=1 Tax=Paenarthrobacter ilicis TaxID=43665 RepID=A0ABX0TI18_9MICC|nr:DinB family protein [Paenarthrobacter ilicis]MBM7794365.1 putative damage-inducible protein DinB [Paenarthrobacter ilicis]NIJ02189.1 putative damage-inducible protein DinB [Paenarthrobacter ilicis]
MDEKATLLHYLRSRRADLLGKLEGLGEYDARRPMTPTGTNLLGLVKHVASVELGYFGETFGRPSGIDLPWLADDAEPDADMWAPASESLTEIVEFHHFSAAHSDATIEALALDAPGVVPWWSEEKKDVTLHQILVHMCVETARHAGHADIIREFIDGTAGQRPNDPNIPPRNSEELAAHRYRLEEAALEADRKHW